MTNFPKMNKHTYVCLEQILQKTSNSIGMSTSIIGSLSLVILQDLFKFESSPNQGKFIGSKLQKLISVQVSYKSVQGGIFSEIK